MFRMLPMLAILLLSGCMRGPAMVGPELAPLAELRYPDEAPYGQELDIVVVRKGGSIELANRTASSYRGMQLWFNEQWVAPAGEIAIGTGNRYPLSHFVDRHQRAFPVAGFLTPEKTRPLVHAVLFDPETGQRHRLPVQLDRRPPVRGNTGTRLD